MRNFAACLSSILDLSFSFGYDDSRADRSTDQQKAFKKLDFGREGDMD